MAVIGNIIIGMKASTGALSKGLKSAAGAVTGFGSAINAINPALLTFGGNIASSVVNPLKDMVVQAFDSIDSLGDTAAKIGTTTEALSRLQWAAQMTGSSSESLNAGLQKMNVQLAKAKAGDATSRTLQKIGLNAEELKSMDPAAAFKEIAGGIANIENPADKAATAMQLFGKGGVDLIGTLSAGTAEIDALAAESDLLGNTIKDVDAANIGAAKDAMDKFWQAIQNVANLIAIQLAPFITDLINKFLEWSTTSINVGDIVKGAFWVVSKAIGIVMDVIHTLKLAFLGLQALITKGIAYLVDGFGFLAKGIQAVANMIPGVETNFSDFFDVVGEDLHKLATEQFENLNEQFLADPPSVGIDNWFNSINEGAKQATTAVDETKKAINSLSDEYLDMTDKVNELEASLKLQIDTWGMTSNEVEIFKLKQAGATDAMLENIKAMDKELQLLEKMKKNEEELNEAAKRVFEDTRTPMEQFETEIGKLQQLFNLGLINKDTFERAKLKAEKDILGGQDDGPQFASAMEQGSQAAREVVLKQMFGAQNDPMKPLEKLEKEQLNKWDIAIPLLRKISNPADADVIVTV